MDERLEKALEFANYRTTLGNQKRQIRSRMNVIQTVHYEKGTFMADSHTIGFVNALIQHGKQTRRQCKVTINLLQIVYIVAVFLFQIWFWEKLSKPEP